MDDGHNLLMPVLLESQQRPRSAESSAWTKSSLNGSKNSSPGSQQNGHGSRHKTPRMTSFSGVDAWAALSHGSKALSNGDAATAAIMPANDASGGDWEQERATLLAHVAALRLNLTASTKSNQQLQRELEEAQRVEPAFETVASAPAFNGGNGGGGGGLPATAAGAAARRRRAFELASAEQRRRVELKAAWQSADRARKEEVRNTTSLQQRLEHAEAVHSIDMGLLQSELRASEHESAHFIAGAELKLARSCLENEAELELQEQLHVLTVRSCEKQVRDAEEVTARLKEEYGLREGALRIELKAARGELHKILQAASIRGQPIESADGDLDEQLAAAAAGSGSGAVRPSYDPLDYKITSLLQEAQHTVGILRGGDEQLLEGAPAAAAAAASSSSSSGARRAASKLDSSSATSSSNSSTSSLTAARPQTPKSPARREGEELALRLRDACGIAVVRAMRNISRFIVQKQFSYWAQTVRIRSSSSTAANPAPPHSHPHSSSSSAPPNSHPPLPPSYIYRSDCCRATAI